MYNRYYRASNLAQTILSFVCQLCKTNIGINDESFTIVRQVFTDNCMPGIHRQLYARYSQTIVCQVFTDKCVAIQSEARLRQNKGSALDNVKTYVDGVSFVHKGNLERDVESDGLHDWAEKKFAPCVSTSAASTSDKTSTHQVSGVVMGMKMSSSYACIFMGHFEYIATPIVKKLKKTNV